MRGDERKREEKSVAGGARRPVGIRRAEERMCACEMLVVDGGREVGYFWTAQGGLSEWHWEPDNGECVPGVVENVERVWGSR